jgi:putative phosphoesterase
MTRPITVGLISDTHGLLRAEAEAALAGVDHIVHAGDIGSPDILMRLSRIAPVHAIRGNNDENEEWAQLLPDTLHCQFGQCKVYVIHSENDVSFDAEAAGIQVIVSGHSHKPRIYRQGTVLMINPGSAGPRRFTLPISVARLRISADSIDAEILTLDLHSVSPRKSVKKIAP